MPAELAQGAFDRSKADAFAARLLTALNDGALCLMASVGHRTGLFDAMSTSAPATSEEIAVRAGLNERYVREWLAAMTAVTAATRKVVIRSIRLYPPLANSATAAPTVASGTLRRMVNGCTNDSNLAARIM